MKISQILEELEEDIKKYDQVFVTTGAQVAMELLVEYTKRAIDDFYSSYSPEYYVRINNIRNNSFLPYFKSGGNSCWGGVQLDSSNMVDYKARISTEEIWKRVMYEGLHGTYQTRDPYSTIYDFSQSGVFIDTVMNAADKFARAQNYKWLFK